MSAQDNNITKLSYEELENVSGGTTNPRDLDSILNDYRAKGGTLEALLDQIASQQFYSIETDGDIRPFRFYYDLGSPEMNSVLQYLREHF